MLEKLPDDTLFKRMRVFMGPSDWSNYTVEADIRITETAPPDGRRRHHRAALYAGRLRQQSAAGDEPWQPEVARAASAPFAWKPDTWYRLKLRVENTADGKTRIRGKAWPAGRTGARGLADRPHRSDPQPQGSPGLFADAQFGVYFDNLKVTPNQ